MTNEERRKALAKARQKALEYAEATERSRAPSTQNVELWRGLAIMWATVAEAMKVGENREADGVIDATPHTIRDGWE